MVDKLSRAAGSVEGSGWAWLGFRKELNRLEIACCPNQDPLWPTHGTLNCALLPFYILFF